MTCPGKDRARCRMSATHDQQMRIGSPHGGTPVDAALDHYLTGRARRTPRLLHIVVGCVGSAVQDTLEERLQLGRCEHAAPAHLASDATRVRLSVNARRKDENGQRRRRPVICGLLTVKITRLLGTTVAMPSRGSAGARRQNQHHAECR